MIFAHSIAVLALAAATKAGGKSYGCIEGFTFYASSGECCSRDHVEVKREGNRVVNAFCTYSPDFELGESMHKWPAHLKGVRKCNFRVRDDIHSCPRGKWESTAALNPPEVRKAMCCPHRFIRDADMNCKLADIDFRIKASSDSYWTSRMYDGCSRKGERGACCEKKHQYRRWDGTCTGFIYDSRFGFVAASRSEVEVRRRSDGCRD
ncbi:hypothetical protein GQ602_000776 [Ophiocordyceps camponoti-floridani]|uniref:Uncharacterized protein n=1 Tax=Ophiocordyceps camponoti-floridani TaxID=2030778 RepID=A0A8H4QD32_9HYPO|nr:hypothetical protein GQ602_000776 [Ophiocordyceps camponoti-floridani]